MARRNRSRRVQTRTLPVPFAGFISLLVFLALGYVWLGSRCEAAGREIKQLEVRRNELKNLLLNEEFKWSRMKSPLELDKALAHHRIEMVLPGMRQVVRLRSSDLPPSAESIVEAPQYASLERAPMNE